MHYENGILHADTHELVGLIRTAQEIIPELDGCSLDGDVELVIDQSPRSPVRVAGFRLTNCVGAYNSGNTLDGLEPRWAWKDAMGVWHRETPSGAMPAGTTRDELVVRRWIANAPPRQVQGSTSPLPPGDYTVEIHAAHVGGDVVRVTPSNGRYVGSIRSPRAYTNVPDSVQGTVTRIVEEWWFNVSVQRQVELINELGSVLPPLSVGGMDDYRLVMRRGRRWYWYTLRGGISPAFIQHAFTGRRAAIRWVDQG